MGKKRIIQKTEEEILKEEEKVSTVSKKSATKAGSKKFKRGRICIQSTYNNTLITITDMQGNVVAWSSAGSIGFRGPKKATPYAATKVVEVLMEKIKKIGIQEIHIFVKGIGSGRDSAVRAFASHGLDIMSIEDVTPIAHNGCRPPKPRRV